jgi:hypothetical protein
MNSVSVVALSKAGALSGVFPPADISTVQRVSLTSASPRGSQGLPNSGKKGNRLPEARHTSMWTFVPSLKAFMT